MEKSLTEIRDFGLTFARLIAGLAVDPHGFFEKKYAARIETAQSGQEIDTIVAQLVEWAGSSAVNDQERSQLDRELDKLGMPSVEDLRLQYLP
jgi:hypothetical protein